MALVSPFSAFSSFLTFSIVRVAQECLAQVGGKASEVEEKRLCVNLVLPGSVERCKKLRLRDVAQIEKWCDCLTYVHRRETRGMFRLVRCTLLRCLQVLFFFFLNVIHIPVLFALGGGTFGFHPAALPSQVFTRA